ncbi:MAG: hypothetical protein RUMPE_00731 [Eubacteriales bacterium SKADARSKE-1]|nr:hypothetical protein [Eubacteriales bacterium SKADARSKE-1]
MYNKKVYWVCLQQALGIGNHKIKDIIENFGTIENLFKASKDEWRFSNIFTSKELNDLKKIDLKWAEKIVSECDNCGYKIVTFEDNLYPERLKNIYNPPAVLYVKGNLDYIDDCVCISIVGTRSATQYGLNVAFDFGYKLSKAGVVVISGGALGIDSAAQKGAVLAGGKVVSVLGCGLNTNYLMKNKLLRDVISKNGALVSEYLPDKTALPQNFPMRNRIISGLSLGTLIVEAGSKSGSLITANLTLEQNKDLFAVPGDIKSAKSVGTNRLIKECAKLVTSVEDILEEYYCVCPQEKISTKEEINKEILNNIKESKKDSIDLSGRVLDDKIKSLSERAKVFYSNLTDRPLHIDELAQSCHMKTSEALQAVTELELKNLIKSNPGKRYSR